MATNECFDLETLSESALEVRETHLSRVFLFERDVFKVKKAVDLGFVDFTSCAARRKACDAEVTLNSRLAPGVYEGVVPVTRGAEGGPVIDFAVHMQRLPDAERADVLLGQGKLGKADIERVAVRIAAFHQGARCDDATARFGSPAIIEWNVEENVDQTRESLRDYLRSDEADDLVRWQLAFLRGHTALFEKRAATGRVRDGHGDLRLEHVYFHEGGITVLDCIEFSDRFRFGDVCADVAFLAMDLASHGRVDLAEHFLATYARETSDFELYALVDFYESYRAFVRGKIAALVATSAATPEARAEAERDARRYFLFALSAHRRAVLLPAVVAVGGVIASGKSTMAARIADALGAPVIEADRIRKFMLGAAPTDDLGTGAFAGAYDPAFTRQVYAKVLRDAGLVAASGRPVVIDASFRSAAMRTDARDLAVARGVPFRFVECVAPRDTCLARLAKRAEGPSVSDGRASVFDDFCARWEAVRELPETEHIVLDTTGPLRDNVARAAARLETWPAELTG